MQYIKVFPIFDLVPNGDSFTFTNTTGSTVYIQQVAIFPYGGTPQVTIEAAGVAWTGTQSSNSQALTLNVDLSAISLAVELDFQASDEVQEVALLPGESIVIDNAGGTGQIYVEVVLAQGVPF